MCATLKQTRLLYECAALNEGMRHSTAAQRRAVAREQVRKLSCLAHPVLRGGKPNAFKFASNFALCLVRMY